jgi:hypothetical protein
MTIKPRIDAWDASLTDEQRWMIYDRFRRHSWDAVLGWIHEEIGIAPPSRSSLYRWADKMRKHESTRRLEQAIIARDEIGALAGTSAANDQLVEAYKSMAAELALQGNAKEAVRLTQMAMQLASQQTAQVELELKQQRLAQQSEAQRLAREKFEAAEARLKAVQDAVNDARDNEGGLSDEALRKIEQAAGLL